MRHWIKSGEATQYVPFYAGVVGLESGATVYRQRGPGSGTTVTVVNIVADGALPGWYRIQINEDTTITLGEETEAVQWLVTHPSLATPIPIDLMLYELLSVNTMKTNGTAMLGNGTAGNLWRGNP